MSPLSHSHTLTLSHSHTPTLSHSLSHSHTLSAEWQWGAAEDRWTLSRSLSHTLTLPHSHTLAHKQVIDWGIANTTLEEAFIKISKGAVGT
jgi:hypothetical protein